MEITAIVDKYLEQLIGLGLNKLPKKIIENEMSAPGNDANKEWKTWLPVKSKVSDSEIQSLENEIGYAFPESYKTFLKHRHFYQLTIAEVSFCSHVVNSWQQGLQKMIFDGYPREFLIDKGLIPFANYSDWGLLCFNTSRKAAGNEYEIVLWDHETWDETTFKYNNFIEMMIALDAEDEICRTSE